MPDSIIIPGSTPESNTPAIVHDVIDDTIKRIDDDITDVETATEETKSELEVHKDRTQSDHEYTNSRIAELIDRIDGIEKNLLTWQEQAPSQQTAEHETIPETPAVQEIQVETPTLETIPDMTEEQPKEKKRNGWSLFPHPMR